MKENIKNDSYIVIQGWMINELNLKGNDLLIYAIIYGFSQDGANSFCGSLQYIADWCNSSRQGIHKNIKNLIDRGLIFKNETYKNGVKFCEYQVVPIEKIRNSNACNSVDGCTTQFTKVCNSVDRGVQQSLQGCTTQLIGVYNSVDRGVQLSCTNKLEYNLEDNINNKLDNKLEDNITGINKSTPDFLNDSLFEIFEDEFGRTLSSNEIMKLQEMQQEYDQLLIRYALREASSYQKQNIDYVDKILFNWKKRDFTTQMYEEGMR